MAAQIALHCHIAVIVKVNGIERAGIEASPASGALALVENDDTVFSAGYGRSRTDIRTRGIIAVPAPLDPEYDRQSAVDYLWGVLPHGNAFDPVRRSVFLLAGNLAGLASPAAVFIN